MHTQKENTAATTTPGFAIGGMTFVNEVMLLQPSIFAASSNSFGMDRK